MSDVNLGDVMSKLHSIQSELRELRRVVESQRRAETEAPAPVVLEDPERGVFLPGTGWTGTQAVPEDAPVVPEPVVPFNEAAERAREAREALRREREDN